MSKCVSCIKNPIFPVYACGACGCHAFCSLECATTKHEKHLCQKLYFRSLFFQLKYSVAFVPKLPFVPPRINYELCLFVDAIIRKNKHGKLSCDCKDRDISTIGCKENIGMGLQKHGDNGYIAYLKCTNPECPGNTKHPLAVFFRCTNNPQTFWGCVSYKEATQNNHEDYNMQLICVRDIEKKPTMRVMTHTTGGEKRGDVIQVSFVVFAMDRKKKTKIAFSEQENKWGKEYYNKDWDFIFINSI